MIDATNKMLKRCVNIRKKNKRPTGGERGGRGEGNGEGEGRRKGILRFARIRAQIFNRS